jgi:hypothetical protein
MTPVLIMVMRFTWSHVVMHAGEGRARRRDLFDQPVIAGYNTRVVHVAANKLPGERWMHVAMMQQQHQGKKWSW